MNEVKKRINVFIVIFLFLLMSSGTLFSDASVRGNHQSNQKINTLSVQANALPLLLNIVWHQHQPVYVNPATNQAELPWVFMHAIKDYKYMADIVPNDINVTFDLTGSLLQQLLNYQDYLANRNNSGAFTDKRIELALTPTANLTLPEKTEIYNYFFDINGQFLSKSGRYTEISNKKQAAPTLEDGINSFTNRDWTDLKALFFLLWMNYDYLCTSGPDDDTFCGSYVGRNPDPTLNDFISHYTGVSTGNPRWSTPFTQENISYIISFGLNLTEGVIPAHKNKVSLGNVEMVTSPLNHPILPLLINLTSARDAQPGTANEKLPVNNTLWPEDASAQLNQSKVLFEQLFNKTQVGLWPSEHAVSPETVSLVNQTGIQWLITDQQQIQKVHPLWNDNANQTYKDHLLYQPYIIEDAISGKSSVTVYRNTFFSDLIGFSYSGLDPANAASNFVGHLKNIYDNFNASSTSVEIKNARHVVTVALDGENAWEHYANNGQFTGNNFHTAFYNAISSAQNGGWLKTITMGQYLNQFGTSNMTKISVTRNQWVGSWIGGDLNTWIGEDEENQGWDRLITIRKELMLANTTDPNRVGANYTRAWQILYQAEGSDWFWWYGKDQSSGRDELFDWIFKLLLRGVLNEIGWTDQQILNKYPFLFVKIKGSIGASVSGYVTPTLDGIASPGEWDLGAKYNDTEVFADNVINEIYTGFDGDGQFLNFRINVDSSLDLTTANNLFLAIYMTNPNSAKSNTYIRYQNITPSTDPLGIEIGWEVALNFTGSGLTSFDLYQADGANGWTLNKSFSSIGISSNIIELQLRFSDLALNPVDNVLINVAASKGSPMTFVDHAPEDGSWSLVVPSGKVSGTIIFTANDDIGDDSINNPANDGTLSTVQYPLNAIFDPGYGHFDAKSFVVAHNDQKQKNIFQVAFETPVLRLDTSWATPTFTLPYTQIYVDTDRIPGSGRTDTIQSANMNIDPNNAWEFMINMEGGPTDQYILFANDTRVDIPNQVVGDSVSKTVTASFDLSITGKASTSWAYVVLIGSKDFNWMRSINANAALWTLGGRSDSSWDPNIIDMFVPSGKNQAELFGNWSEGNYFATAFAIGPGLVYEVDTTPPTVSISTPTAGKTYTGTSKVTILIIWNATDNFGLARGEIYMNQILITQLNATAKSYTFDWYTNGEYLITVRWYDFGDKNFGDGTVNITITGLSESTDPFYEVPVPSHPITSGVTEYSTVYASTTASISSETSTTSPANSPGFGLIILLTAILSLSLINNRRKNK